MSTKRPGDQSGFLDGVLLHVGSCAGILFAREDPPLHGPILRPSRGQVETFKGQLGKLARQLHGKAQKAARGKGIGSCIGSKRKTSAAAGATQTERQIEADQMEEG